MEVAPALKIFSWGLTTLLPAAVTGRGPAWCPVGGSLPCPRGCLLLLSVPCSPPPLPQAGLRLLAPNPLLSRPPLAAVAGPIDSGEGAGTPGGWSPWNKVAGGDSLPKLDTGQASSESALFSCTSLDLGDSLSVLRLSNDYCWVRCVEWKVPESGVGLYQVLRKGGDP